MNDSSTAETKGTASNGPSPGVAVARKGRLRKPRKLVKLLQHPTWRRALVRNRVAAAIEHRDVPFGADFATIIDVGAHHGQFALLARDLFPQARITCVEPLPPSVSVLRKVIGDDSLTSIAEVAVAAAEGTQNMHVSHKTDSSSLLPILQPYVDAFPGTEESNVVPVPVTTLDTLFDQAIARPCLLKIDAQGGELEVLEGAARVLQQVDMAYIECSFVEFYEGQALADEVVCALLKSGLRLDGAYSVVQDANKRCLQADLLFRRHS